MQKPAYLFPSDPLLMVIRGAVCNLCAVELSMQTETEWPTVTPSIVKVLDVLVDGSSKS